VRTAPQHAQADVAFPAGYSGVFATCGGSDVRLWALDTCRELQRIREPGLASACLAFSPDGGALAAGWSDGAVRACAGPALPGRAAVACRVVRPAHGAMARGAARPACSRAWCCA